MQRCALVRLCPQSRLIESYHSVNLSLDPESWWTSYFEACGDEREADGPPHLVAWPQPTRSRYVYWKDTETALNLPALSSEKPWTLITLSHGSFLLENGQGRPERWQTTRETQEEIGGYMQFHTRSLVDDHVVIDRTSTWINTSSSFISNFIFQV